MNFDVHTHILRRNALVDLDPVDHRTPCSAFARQLDLQAIPLLRPGYSYSVGIHPWNATRVAPADLRLLRALVAQPQVKAIGECGLDPLRQNPDNADLNIADRASLISLQTDLLHLHFELSELWCKPLLLHIVRTYPEIIGLRRKWKPAQPWIIHGFRGRPQLARQLLADGFYLSFGAKYNPESFALTPPDRRLRETDALSPLQ
ncbi:TatD family hydrolase [Duncaniella muris]|uniref:TatD family hydrolase n=1 Tax=Duncaniella muris TaxID=2094150 RepID=UPI001369EAEF|nr:TatD family hydrolase [Duncaniella muris]NBH91968.1 hydrolase TatD [Muribaculaceae bacterium S4]NBI19938.1 hydrolase TatD [Muribaculaceae bacterium Z1]